MLKQAFDLAIRLASPYATTFYLLPISENLEQIDVLADAGDRIAGQYRSDMMRFCSDPGFALDADKIRSFSEIFGEVHFYCYCKSKGVDINRIPSQANLQTPDFCLSCDESVTFEVKTLSVVNGSSGLRQDMDSSLEAHVSLEEQINNGATFAVAHSGVNPFGLAIADGEEVSCTIDRIYEKITNNLKPGQFAATYAFIVVNLLYLDSGPVGANHSLAPVGCIAGTPTPVTGPLWTLAFGRRGCHIHGIPRFEGLPAVEGVQEYNGLLVGPDDPSELSYDYLSGMLFMRYSMRGHLLVSGLYRYSDHGDWNSAQPGLAEAMRRVVEDSWNDDRNSNGHSLLALPCSGQT